MKIMYPFFFGNSVQNPEFLIFFRISVGIILLIQLIALGSDFNNLYGIDKTLPTDIQTYNLTNSIVYYDDIVYFFSRILNISIYSSEALYYSIFLILCIFIIIGFFSRFSAFLLLFLQIGLIKSSYFYTYGVDFFCSMSLFYLVLFPSDDYYSLRKKIFKNFNTTSNITTFKRLMQIHLCWAYGVSGIEKISGYNWRNGESVWKALHLPSFETPFIEYINYLGQFPWIFVITGWIIIIIELLYPVFINIKKTREIWLYLTILMHFFIALFLNLYFFSVIMIIWNLTNFYFEDKIKITNK